MIFFQHQYSQNPLQFVHFPLAFVIQGVVQKSYMVQECDACEA